MITFVLLRSGQVGPVAVSSKLDHLLVLIPDGLREVSYQRSKITHREIIGEWANDKERIENFVTYRIIAYVNV